MNDSDHAGRHLFCRLYLGRYAGHIVYRHDRYHVKIVNGHVVVDLAVRDVLLEPIQELNQSEFQLQDEDLE